MITVKNSYSILYRRVLDGEVVPCWIDHQWANDGYSGMEKINRDICQCKMWKNGDVVFSVRGCNYGGVEGYMDLQEDEKKPYFIRFCEKFNIEYVV